ncbi:M23 family metallopeptidase [Microlunatus soli]|uniref:Peptidase family M23 n=1 Tax=Microlunatus soli TaxID=630515 RepID=A0A1H1QEK5_9ACTN|nr:M23 family metallopeptidase [Microlunatus soli]SDS21856.1 Peptidase family M23 [Microlunatus soli]
MEAHLDVAYPFTGTWRVQNSPADRVPSHGTAALASSHAIDFVPVTADGKSAPIRLASLLRTEPPDRFPGYGRPILAPVDGIVVATSDDATDHDAYRGVPSIGYALTQQQRLAGGWPNLAGNHLLIESDGVVIALCHLQRSSLRVTPGERVRTGAPIARCGNSGNSTEPHVHVQAIDRVDVEQARAVPLSFRGVLPHNGDVLDVPE